MIIANGTIEFISKSAGGGIDSNGYPIAATASYSTPIPCQFTANNHSYLGKSEGEAFIRASYSILVEYLSATAKTERLRLKNKNSVTVGEFSVLQFEDLDAVSQTRILV